MAEKNGSVTWKVVASALASILILIGGLLYAGHDKRIETAEKQISVNTPRLSSLEAWKEGHDKDENYTREEMAKIREDMAKTRADIAEIKAMLKKK